MQKIILKYKRMDADKTVGMIVHKSSDKWEDEVVAFSAMGWVPMMTLFAKALQEYPEAGGTIQRTDREGLVPFHLGELELERFRTDPAGAIRAMTFTSSRVVKTESVNAMQPVPAALDALVDIFGDVLWLRVFDTKGGSYAVECPVTAKSVLLNVSVLHLPDGQVLHFTELNYASQGWAGVPTTELLLRGYERYFLPRAWNPSGAWITWADLNSKNKDFEQEREIAP